MTRAERVESILSAVPPLERLRLLDVREAARLLALSPASLYRLVAAGRISHIKLAGRDMHPLDTRDRARFIKDEAGVGLCNITKCCTEVCPEHIHITDNALIPLKERVVTENYDPVAWIVRKLSGKV